MTQSKCKSKWCSNKWRCYNSNSKSCNKCKVVEIMRCSRHPWVKYSSNRPIIPSITNHRSKQINLSSHRWVAVQTLSRTLWRNSKLWRIKQLHKSWAVSEPTSVQRLGKQLSARRNSSCFMLNKYAKLWNPSYRNSLRHLCKESLLQEKKQMNSQNKCLSRGQNRYLTHNWLMNRLWCKKNRSHQTSMMRSGRRRWKCWMQKIECMRASLKRLSNCLSDII